MRQSSTTGLITMHGNCWSGKILNGTTKKSTLTTDFSQMKKCNSIFKYFEQFYILISSNDISIFIPFDMHIQQLIYFRGCPCVRLFAMGCFYLCLCSSFWADVYLYIYSYVICMFRYFFFKLFQPKEMLNLHGILVLLFDFVGAYFYLIGCSSPPGVSLNSLRLILLSFDSTTSLDLYQFLSLLIMGLTTPIMCFFQILYPFFAISKLFV